MRLVTTKRRVSAAPVRAIGGVLGGCGQAEHGAGAGGSRVRARQTLAQRGEVLARVDVEQQRRRPLDLRRSRRPRAPAPDDARSCRGRSWERSRPGGASSSPLVPVPCRSGTIVTSATVGSLSPPPAARCPAARRAPRGRAPGQSPGMHSTRSNPSAIARLDAKVRPPRSGPPRRCPSRPAHPGSARPRRPSPRRVTTIVRSIEAVWPRPTSTSPTIARASVAAAAGRRRSRRGAAWPGAKRLTGRIAAVRMPERTCPASRHRRYTTDGRGGGSRWLYQPSSIRPTVTPGPIVTISPRSPGSGSQRSIVSLST